MTQKFQETFWPVFVKYDDDPFLDHLLTYKGKRWNFGELSTKHRIMR